MGTDMDVTDTLNTAVKAVAGKAEALAAAEKAFESAQSEYNAAVAVAKDAHLAVQAWVAKLVPGAAASAPRTV